MEPSPAGMGGYLKYPSMSLITPLLLRIWLKPFPCLHAAVTTSPPVRHRMVLNSGANRL